MDQSVEQFMPQSIVENNRAVSWQLVGLNSCLWLGKEMVKENPAKITVICRVTVLKASPSRSNIAGFTLGGENRLHSINPAHH